jgi:AP-2 complex subunit mu-1
MSLSHPTHFRLTSYQVLISRLFRTDVKWADYSLLCLLFDVQFLNRRSISDVFRIQVISSNDVRSPIITLGSTSFFHVRVNNLYVVAVTKFVHVLMHCQVSS